MQKRIQTTIETNRPNKYKLATPTAGLPMRTDIRAGMGEEITTQLEAWWQNLTSSLTAQDMTSEGQ